jgi:hypothetical protein
MSFDSNKKKDNLKKIPLIEENINSQLSTLQIRFVEFLRDLDELNNYEKKINKLSKQDYDAQKDEMYLNIYIYF